MSASASAASSSSSPPSRSAAAVPYKLIASVSFAGMGVFAGKLMDRLQINKTADSDSLRQAMRLGVLVLGVIAAIFHLTAARNALIATGEYGDGLLNLYKGALAAFLVAAETDVIMIPALWQLLMASRGGRGLLHILLFLTLGEFPHYMLPNGVLAIGVIFVVAGSIHLWPETSGAQGTVDDADLVTHVTDEPEPRVTVPRVTAVPELEPEPRATAVPELEPEPRVTAVPVTVPVPRVTAVPVTVPVPRVTAVPVTVTRVTAVPVTVPRVTVPRVTAVPEPVPRVTAVPELELEPFPELELEPFPEPEPLVTAVPEPEPEPRVTAVPEPEPRVTAEYEGELRLTISEL